MVREIYLAGGCFWGTQEYMRQISGVLSTQVGFAGGHTQNTSYKEVCRGTTGHAEVVKVLYDDNVVSLPFLLALFYETIDPTSVNRQGGDSGEQYRTGVYYTQEEDRSVIEQSLALLQTKYSAPVVVEVQKVQNYVKAEEEHQLYLEKHPRGYCHIQPGAFQRAKQAKDANALYTKKEKQALEQQLTSLQYDVTQKNGTEPPFKNEFNETMQQGIYVDVTTGQPLFVSTDKFVSGCGWPAFAKPIYEGLLQEVKDHTHGMIRTEVRSKLGDAHLGHVFEDGPKERGGLRYCINSAALRFVPKEEMEQNGYGEYVSIVR